MQIEREELCGCGTKKKGDGRDCGRGRMEDMRDRGEKEKKEERRGADGRKIKGR